MRFVSRATWGARAPSSRSKLAATFGVTVHYEGPHLGDYIHGSCASKVRGIQNFHMDARGWADIAYSAIVCRHGYTFEGRWAGVRTAANGTNDGNDTAYAVCLLIGVDDSLPGIMLGELIETIDHLNNAPGVGQRVNGHRDWKATACPGDVAYRELPNIRAALLNPGPRPTPAPLPPPLVTTYASEVPPMKSYDVAVPTDDHGRGYRDLPGLDPAKIVSIVVNGGNPSDGYDAGVDKPPYRVNVGGVARIVVPASGVIKGRIAVTVWAVA